MYIINEMQTIITSLTFSKYLIWYLHKCFGLVVFWEGGGRGYCPLRGKRRGGIMKETFQSFEKPLERYCQKTINQPHERTHSSNPPQIHPKNQMTK
jgi:hypothetical protein